MYGGSSYADVSQPSCKPLLHCAALNIAVLSAATDVLPGQAQGATSVTRFSALLALQSSCIHTSIVRFDELIHTTSRVAVPRAVLLPHLVLRSVAK